MLVMESRIAQFTETATETGKNLKPAVTVTVTGITSKGYFVSIKLTYTIGRLNLAAEESTGNIVVITTADIKYAKDGANPQLVMTHTDSGTVSILREGVDYTLKYSSNTAVGGTTKPVLGITCISNYCGTIRKTFDIGAQDIGTQEITTTDK